MPEIRLPRDVTPVPVMPGYPQSGMIRQAHALWLSACGDRDLPARADLLAALPGSLKPFTILFAIETAPLDFRYVEIGARVQAVSNADNTGRRLAELPHQRPPSKVWDHLSAAFDARAPVKGVLPYVGKSRDFSSVFHIVLPLSEDGAAVDHLLVCVDLTPALRLDDGIHPFTQLG